MSEREFGSAITSHTKPLMGFAMKLTRDYDEANDLLQETFFKAYRNQHRFQEGTNLSAWLFTIMKNAFITNYQRMIRQKTFVDNTEDLHHINSSSIIVSNAALHELSMKELNDAIDAIEVKFSEPFMMYFKGFKYHEIAERLGLPLGTIKNRIHVARNLLQEIIQRNSKYAVPMSIN